MMAGIKSKLRWVLTGAVLLAFALYLAFNLEQFKPLQGVNVAVLLIIVLVNVAVIVSNGLFTKVVLGAFGKSISVFESAYVSLISSVGNFFATAGAGAGLRAVYLKKRHDLPYSDYMALLYGNYLLVFLVSSFFGLLSLYLLRGQQGGPYFVLVIVFAGIFGASLLLSLVRLPKRLADKLASARRIGKLAGAVARMIEGWNNVLSNRRLMLRMVGLSLLNFALTTLLAWLVITSLGLDISLPALLFFGVLGSLSTFVNLTPANLGVKEAIYLFSGQVIGFSTGEILTIALIDRGVLFMTLAVLWLASARSGLRRGAAGE